MPSTEQVKRKRGKRGGKKTESSALNNNSLNESNAFPVEVVEPRSQDASPQIHASRRMQMESALNDSVPVSELNDQENPKLKKTRRGRRGGKGASSVEQVMDQVPEMPEIQKTQRGKRKRGEEMERSYHHSPESSIPELDAETRSYFENLEKVMDEQEFETEEGNSQGKY